MMMTVIRIVIVVVNYIISLPYPRNLEYGLQARNLCPIVVQLDYVMVLFLGKRRSSG